eukprot:3940487-Rhodomonas_salina.3
MPYAGTSQGGARRRRRRGSIALSSYARAMRCAVLTYCMLEPALRMWYAVCGTEILYAATQCAVLTHSVWLYTCATRCAVLSYVMVLRMCYALVLSYRMVLCMCYAVCGTEKGYGATRSAVLSSRMVLAGSTEIGC